MAASPVTHPQLRQLLRELDEATTRATRLAEVHDDRAFSARPSATSWSAAEAIAHLTLTGRGMLPAIDRALEGAAALPGIQRYKMDPLGAVLRWTLEPPYRMKTPTTPPFVPLSVADRQVVIREFLALQGDVAACLGRANGRALDRLKVTSPFSGKVKYNVYAAFRILITHERRHLWQAEQAARRMAGSQDPAS